MLLTLRGLCQVSIPIKVTSYYVTKTMTPNAKTSDWVFFYWGLHFKRLGDIINNRQTFAFKPKARFTYSLF